LSVRKLAIKPANRELHTPTKACVVTRRIGAWERLLGYERSLLRTYLTS
jgi:hypothetical protein